MYTQFTQACVCTHSHTCTHVHTQSHMHTHKHTGLFIQDSQPYQLGSLHGDYRGSEWRYNSPQHVQGTECRAEDARST